jgi:hypothetical protein
VVEDPLDDVRLCDEPDDPHGAGAPGADEGIDLVDAAQEIGPALARGRGGGSGRNLGGVDLDASGLNTAALASGGIGVEAMVADEVLARGRDLGEDAGDVFEGVDALGPGGAGVVAGALEEVEHLVLPGEQP